MSALFNFTNYRFDSYISSAGPVGGDEHSSNVKSGVGALSGQHDTFEVGDEVTSSYTFWWGVSNGIATATYRFLGYTSGATKYPVIGSTYVVTAVNPHFTSKLDIILGPGSGTVDLIVADLACYLTGTMILTAEGEKPVETLREGDLIHTRFGGLRPLRWLGRNRVHASKLAADKMPVCIHANALADGVPTRDLWITADHNVVIDDQLVTAELLVNGATITQPAQDGMIAYFHLDFGVHDCVLADGAWADSYAERDNRDTFDNHDDFLRANPDHQPVHQEFCLPLLNHASPELAAIREAITARIPVPSLTDDPDLHLLADGRRVDPVLRDGGRWEFLLDAPAARLVLRSRVQVPEAIGLSADGRSLGIALRRIEVHSALGETRLEAGSPILTNGLHPVEGTSPNLWRWTRGDVTLPPYGRQAPLRLIVHGTGLGQYALAAPDAGLAAPALRHAA